jgi:hypothetical protein
MSGDTRLSLESCPHLIHISLSSNVLSPLAQKFLVGSLKVM